ncbi:hypothetical protein [Spirosoma luteum]|uniref:hypothetical protein n=1 Tax=Spirosoma luteum TaxID=431553 RepID=UPI0003668793|nr:hypothetical protein [Spirosoma luteum]
MKKIYFTFIIISLIIDSVQAQQTSPAIKSNPWGWGVFAGVNYSYPIVGTEGPAHFSPQANLVTGADVHYRLNYRASLRVQPSWTRVSNITAIGGGSQRFSLSTLKIPVLYRNYVLPTHKLLFLEVGVSYNRIVDSNYREVVQPNCIVAPCPPFYGSEIPPLTKSAVSGIAGLGVDIPVNRVTIPVTLRYERYLSSYLFPSAYTDRKTPVQFETVSLTTGINF